MCSLCILAWIITALVAAPPSQSSEYAPTQTGRTILDIAGIKTASDIESAVFDFGDVAYTLTSKREPELLKRFYDRLLCTREDRPDACPVAAYVNVIITRSDGRLVEMVFGRRAVEGHPDKIPLAEGYWVPDMAEVFDDIRKDAKAAALDFQSPSFEVANLEVRVPDLGTRDVPPPSPEGKAVIAKAQAIIDWLDLRTARAQEISEREFIPAKRKFTTVTLTTKTPVRFEALVIDSTKPPIYEAWPIGRNLKTVHFDCDTLIVMDYGNYTPPVVVAMDQYHTYYLFRDPYTDLRRRNEERILVEKLGFPGHPITDKEYYKSPQVLYKELQELARTALEKYGAGGQAGR